MVALRKPRATWSRGRHLTLLLAVALPLLLIGLVLLLTGRQVGWTSVAGSQLLVLGSPLALTREG